MGIRSTQYISRENAIERIKTVASLILDQNYVALEVISFDPEENIRSVVDSGIDFDIDNIEKWTDTMLADKLDEPFFRFSMFDNYLVGEER